MNTIVIRVHLQDILIIKVTVMVGSLLTKLISVILRVSRLSNEIILFMKRERMSSNVTHHT